MASRTVTVELPEELVQLLGAPEELAMRVREVIVLDLLRRARITQAQAADLLWLSLWDFLPLITRHQVATGPETPEDLDREVEDLRRYLQGN